MLRGLQPLKLLESATAAARGVPRARRPAILDDDDDEDDDSSSDEEALFSSPPEVGDEDPSPTLPSPTQRATAVRSPAAAPPVTTNTSAAASTSLVAPETPKTDMDNAPSTYKEGGEEENLEEETLQPASKEMVPKNRTNTSTSTSTKKANSDNKKSATPKTKKASTTSSSTRKIVAGSNTITPCHKGPAPSNTTGSAITVGMMIPAATPTPGAPAHAKKTKNRRLGILEQTSETSLSLVRKLVQYTESTCKSQQDALKRAQKHVKLLQHQLEDAQQVCKDLQSQADAALQDKKVASRDYKKLVKQWEKCQAADEKKESELKQAVKEAKKRRVSDNIIAEGKPPTKKAKTTTGKSNNKQKKKRSGESDDDSSSSESSGPEGIMNEDGDSSEEDDSDWEGAKPKKKGKLGTKTADHSPAPASATKRSRRRAAPAEWTCSRCTFLNRPDLEECDMCGILK